MWAGAVLAAASKCNTPNVKVQPPSRAGPPPSYALRKRQPVTQKKLKEQQEQEAPKADKASGAASHSADAGTGSATAVPKVSAGILGKVSSLAPTSAR